MLLCSGSASCFLVVSFEDAGAGGAGGAQTVTSTGAATQGGNGAGGDGAGGDGAGGDGAGGMANELEVAEVVAGGLTCVRTAGMGRIRCWGPGGSGQLGNASTDDIGDNELPSGTIQLMGDAAQISVGDLHACARLATGQLYCWGHGANGRLGLGDQNNCGDGELVAACGTVNLIENVSHVAAGGSHTCAVLQGGAIRCWGQGTNGRLGYNNTSDILTPVSDVDLGGATATQVTVGAAHTCALLGSGAVRCWGLGADGRLGTASTSDAWTPQPVHLGEPALSISAGGAHTCAVMASGALRCWGRSPANGHTQTIGDGETPASVGYVVPGGSADIFVQVSSGGNHTCALTSEGAVYCWGEADMGQLGLDGTTDVSEPMAAPAVQVGGVVKNISAGETHTCASLSNGRVRCWGSGAGGRLGYGNLNNIGDTEHPYEAGDVPLLLNTN